MLINCLMGMCWFLAPVALDATTHAMYHGAAEPTYVKSCEFSPAPAMLECVQDPDTLSRNGFE